MLTMHLFGVYVKMRRKISFRSEWESVMLAVDDERQWQQMKCINRLPPSSSIFAFCLFSSSNSFHFMRMGEKSLSAAEKLHIYNCYDAAKLTINRITRRAQMKPKNSHSFRKSTTHTILKWFGAISSDFNRMKLTTNHPESHIGARICAFVFFFSLILIPWNFNIYKWNVTSIISFGMGEGAKWK